MGKFGKPHLPCNFWLYLTPWRYYERYYVLKYATFYMLILFRAEQSILIEFVFVKMLPLISAKKVMIKVLEKLKFASPNTVYMHCKPISSLEYMQGKWICWENLTKKKVMILLRQLSLEDLFIENVSWFYNQCILNKSFSEIAPLLASMTTQVHMPTHIAMHRVLFWYYFYLCCWLNTFKEF